MIQIEKNIPMPAAGLAGRKAKYPFKGMVAGDSFAVPLDTSVPERRAMQRITSAANAWATRNSVKLAFSVRVVTEKVDGEDAKRVRLWADHK